jgi:hypothetical protein
VFVSLPLYISNNLAPGVSIAGLSRSQIFNASVGAGV